MMGVIHGSAAIAIVIATLVAAGCTEIKYTAGRLPGTQVQAPRTPTPKSTTRAATGKVQAANPQTTSLESRLRLGVATEKDVKAALGEPVGRGVIMIPFVDKKPRRMWTYYYETGFVRAEGKALSGDSRRLFMMIYFDDQGRFDGYQWFSSLPQHAFRR
ncbi:MAG: hypothetical protein O7I42_27465 [Alphaproteobacteria bacterium]|nr:hypothetical protein [Alphaproteobacteria bacterium]